MIKLAFIVVIVALGIIFITTRKISNRLSKIEEEAQRHNNIQKVLLEQIDNISTRVGV